MASTGENGRATSCASEISDRRPQKRSRARPRRAPRPLLDFPRPVEETAGLAPASDTVPPQWKEDQHV